MMLLSWQNLIDTLAVSISVSALSSGALISGSLNSLKTPFANGLVRFSSSGAAIILDFDFGDNIGPKIVSLLGCSEFPPSFKVYGGIAPANLDTLLCEQADFTAGATQKWDQPLLVFPAGASIRYMRIRIVGSDDNPYFDLRRIWVGNGLEMIMAEGFQQQAQDNSKVQRSTKKQPFVNRGNSLKTLRVSTAMLDSLKAYGYMQSTDGYLYPFQPTLDRAFNEAGDSGEVFLLPYYLLDGSTGFASPSPAQDLIRIRHSVYGFMKNRSAIKKEPGEFFSASFEVEEIPTLRG